MIWLTGDLHDMSLKSGNQAHCLKKYGLTEIEVAKKYLDLLEDANVKVTFFITGRAFKHEWEMLKPIAEHPLVEIGGHTWNCYLSPWCELTGIRIFPALWARTWNKLAKSYNGPLWYHRCDTKKTIDTIKEKTGKEIIAWRHHMYMHGQHSERVMKECGIKLLSDEVKKDISGPFQEDGLWQFPLNIIPDHEHIYHAERTREWVQSWQKRYNWSDDFGSESYDVKEWADLAIEGLKSNEQRKATSSMIIHPITMYLCDEFEQFKRVLKVIKEQKTVHAAELVDAP
jgi:peptidoglycan/xylan/chitin deacetylase (PgdA/CDA1 family)